MRATWLISPPRRALLLRRTIVLAPRHVVGLVVRIGPEQREESAAIAVVAIARAIVAGDAIVLFHRRRRLARDETALGLIAQHRDEFGTIIGFGAERFVGDDDRGPRQG